VDATPFGHYQLQKLIGRGGMGEVYRAYDTKTDRIVALKVLPHHLAEDATFQQRFRRESQAAAGLNDPHVVPIHGYCGLKIGVTYACIQETEEVRAKSDQCVAAGVSPIDKVVYTRQDNLTAALIAGEVEAMAADSPVTGFAIKLSGGELAPAGEIFDTAPYGWPVAKGSGLGESLRRALEHLMQTGEYRTIATLWGVENGMIGKPVINGAVR
jgi:hypothetical protein